MRKVCWCLGLCVSFMWADGASGQAVTLPVDAAVTMDQPTSRGHSAVAALLRKRIEGVDWLENTLELVVDWLRDSGDGKVNVIVRWGPLNVEGVGRESLVTLKMANSTVGEVLNETLDQLSETGEITYHGSGNTIWISSRQDFGRKLYLRVYDVTDILFRVPDFGREAPVIDLQQASRSGGGGGGGGGGGQGVFGGSSTGQGQEQGGEQAEQDIQERLERLRDLIQETVAPETWDVGTGSAATGGRGRIRIYNTSLIVYNTIEVHEMINGEFFYGG